MRVNDMYLKNEVYLFYSVIIFFILVSYKAYSNTEQKTKVLGHLVSLKNFSASFLQNDGENLSEGKVYIGKNRVRAEYISPAKILIILDEDKAMYYNYDLEEDEFFNPKNTNAWFFYDLFRNPFFLKDSLVKLKDNEIILEKAGVDSKQNNYLIKTFFENNPLILRKVEVFINDNFLQLSIFDHEYNKEFDDSFFKLINPKLLN